MTVRLPDDVRAAIGDEPVSAWLVEAARRRIAEQEGRHRWRPLLGDALADRVAALTTDPATFCRVAISEACTAAEAAARRRATVEAGRAACPHPARARRGNRCTLCGAQRPPPS